MEGLFLGFQDIVKQNLILLGATMRKKKYHFLGLLGFLIFQAWQILEETLSISRLSFILFEFLAGYTHFNCLLAFGKCPTKFERLLGTSSLGVIFSTNII